ncbi:MAG: PaaI family thioesterase [Rhodobacteraceae bacterium]|nr:PaaI family thioesterase [Paracoccaceae bacterium]
MSLAMNKPELSAYLSQIFSQIINDFAIDALDMDGITMRLKVATRHLRPGGTVSGPSMFALADVAVYAMILSRLGPKALAVTTSSSMDFLRKPEGGSDIVARGRLLKLGRSLVVGDVLMFPAKGDKPLARATMTYSIPPN